MAQNPFPSNLDQQQILQRAFDQAEDRLRVDASLSATIIPPPGLEVSITQVDDSIRIGDGTNLVTTTTIGPDVGLDVNIINPISVEINAADGDNIAIHDADGDELAINADGSINVNSTQSGTWNINNIAGTISLPTGAALESTLSTLNAKVNNDYGVSSGAVRTASQIGNTTGAANFNAGVTGAQTLRTTSNITRNGTELSYNSGASDANTLRTASNTADGAGNLITSTLSSSKRVLNVSRVAVATDRYMAFISVRQSATTAAGAVIWSMRNDAAATKNAYIDDILVQMSFDVATPVVRSTPRYSFIRFSGATPTGGTQVTPVRFDTANAAPQVTDIRTACGGLTIPGGLVQAETITIPGVPACDGSTMVYPLTNLGIRLAPGEGILVSLLTTAVIGQYIGGSVIWSER